MLHRDYLMRMLAQIAAMLTKARKHREAQQWAQADQALAGALEELGIPRPIFESADAATLRMMLQSEDKREAAGEILDELAALAEAEGRAQRASDLRSRARAMNPA